MTETRQWYAVRCCCRPETIFGFIQLEAKSLAIGPDTTRRAVVFDDRGTMRHIRLALYGDYSEQPGYEELAVLSGDQPLDWWRTIDGFVVNPHQDDGRDK